VNIRHQLSKEEFIQLNLAMLFRRPYAYVTIGIGLLAIFSNPKNFLIGLIMIAWLPVLTVIGAMMSFKPGNRLRENILYQFTQDKFSMSGDTFSQEVIWQQIHQVKKTRNWILIFVSPKIANGIPKKELVDVQLEDLRLILNANGVKNNL
jgi:hypothetical protein